MNIKQHLSLLAALSLAAFSALSISSCSPSASSQTKIAPGQFEWQPENSPSGPVLMVVSLDDQMAYVYRNGIQIGRSSVSTGKPGHDTPTGVFTILQREVEHYSSLYDSAPMPYMQRLTWGGIAMHAGYLPGYPASHGCIRLPHGFSQKLYGAMHKGATVVIAKKTAVPEKSSKPASILLASQPKPSEKPFPSPDGKMVWNPGKSRSGPFSMLISYADKTIYVWRNGIQIGQSPISILPGANPPEGVFMRLTGQANWTTLSLHGGNTSGNAVATMKNDILVPDSFSRKIRSLITPGTILVSTQKSSNKNTRSGRNFKIIN